MLPSSVNSEKKKNIEHNPSCDYRIILVVVIFSVLTSKNQIFNFSTFKVSDCQPFHFIGTLIFGDSTRIANLAKMTVFRNRCLKLAVRNDKKYYTVVL